VTDNPRCQVCGKPPADQTQLYPCKLSHSGDRVVYICADGNDNPSDSYSTVEWKPKLACVRKLFTPSTQSLKAFDKYDDNGALLIGYHPSSYPQHKQGIQSLCVWCGEGRSTYDNHPEENSFIGFCKGCEDKINRAEEILAEPAEPVQCRNPHLYEAFSRLSSEHLPAREELERCIYNAFSVSSTSYNFQVGADQVKTYHTLINTLTTLCQELYAQGFEDGDSLIKRLAVGEVTVSQYNEKKLIK
jgi:hypothetical protein